MKANDVTLKPGTNPDRIPSACDALNMTEWQATNQPTKIATIKSCQLRITTWFINSLASSPSDK